MKNSTLLLTLFIFFNLQCATQLPQGGYEDGEVRFVNNTEIEKGTTYLLAIGVDKTQDKAKARAKMHAVKKILFTGVAESNVARPIVDAEAQSKHKAYFDNKFFISEGPYLNYIVETAMEPNERRKITGGYRVGVYVKVYYSQLQTKLENDGIIKKFGI